MTEEEKQAKSRAKYQKRKEYFQQWYQENKEKRDKQNKEWAQKNRKRQRAHNRKYYWKNVDKIREKNREKYLKKKQQDPEYHARKAREWRVENKDEILDRKLKKMGSSIEEYKSLEPLGCAICKKMFGDYRHTAPNIDHDHDTGKFRGLLCNPCNRGIGYLQDSVELLKQAADYLDKKT